jgi:hypothetical protein
MSYARSSATPRQFRGPVHQLMSLLVIIALLLPNLPAASIAPAIRAATFSAKVNFQLSSTTVTLPEGYVKDVGDGFAESRGYGWVRQDSLSGARVPLSIVNNTRDRTVCSSLDIRLRTLVHMQAPQSATTQERTPAAWEYTLPNGTYAVTVAVGEPVAGQDVENHVINVEASNAIEGFVPSGANCSPTRQKTVTVVVPVADGKLTIDAIGGTNTKLSYVEITDDLTGIAIPPANPGGLRAATGDNQVQLNWTDNTESDLRGYNVYRSTTTPVSTSGTPLNGATPVTTSEYTDITAPNGVVFYYAVKAIDTSGNASGRSLSVRGMADTAAPPNFTLPVKVNFQNEATTPPPGYSKDFGENYANLRGYGWVVPGTSTPLSLVGNGRNRNTENQPAGEPDLRLATLMHMQGDTIPTFSNVRAAGAWEVALPNGSYSVEVSVGDAKPGNDTTSHKINVEGIKAIDNFAVNSTTTGDARYKSATLTATVNDGRLTIDAVGGTNTKINYVVISAATPADTTAPMVESAIPGDTGSNIPVDTDVAIEFSEPVQGVNGTTFTLSKGSEAVAATVTYNAADTTATLAPNADLEPGTLYTVRLTPDITDLAGNKLPAYQWTFTTAQVADTTAPDTTITSGPAEGATITTATASFEFASSEAGSSFECKLDGGDWADCTSPEDLANLPDGSHTFSVRAIDAAGNTDASPATRSFTSGRCAGDQRARQQQLRHRRRSDDQRHSAERPDRQAVRWIK